MPGPSTRLILGSDLEYHRRLDGLTPGEENSFVSRRTQIENRQLGGGVLQRHSVVAHPPGQGVLHGVSLGTTIFADGYLGIPVFPKLRTYSRSDATTSG